MAAGSAWTPGHRRIPGQLFPATFHKFVKATLNMGYSSLVQYRVPAEEANTDSTTNFRKEEGEVVFLNIRHNGRPGILLNLTMMTEEELTATQKFINDTIEQARPLVQERDAIARKAEADGDYSFARSNRAHPKVAGNPR